ncbi:acylphosphatase [Halobacteriovorax sp. HLS]|uniref:acylphosphatase n=1 Tax=Halobacteriovorax sp. HLS TaxID=2234000 RepID=UPI000FD93A4C|nr:acylphosphatase [Halobacteriovorax sp. HLS]
MIRKLRKGNLNMIEASFEIFGKVQGVMFRKTLIRACHNRSLEAGATNDRLNLKRVTFSVIGEESEVEKLCNDLLSLSELNSWGASATALNKLGDFVKIDNHEVTTRNFQQIKFSNSVEFFL